MFIVLGAFVAAATTSWCFRRSPWAKKSKARRRRKYGGSAEENVLDSYAKMSRQQQKSFAMQATVAMLQDSRVRVCRCLWRQYGCLRLRRGPRLNRLVACRAVVSGCVRSGLPLSPPRGLLCACVSLGLPSTPLVVFKSCRLTCGSRVRRCHEPPPALVLSKTVESISRVRKTGWFLPRRRSPIWPLFVNEDVGVPLSTLNLYRWTCVYVDLPEVRQHATTHNARLLSTRRWARPRKRCCPR